MGGKSCVGSGFGDCCSVSGWCGDISAYCGAGARALSAIAIPALRSRARMALVEELPDIHAWVLSLESAVVNMAGVEVQWAIV